MAGKIVFSAEFDLHGSGCGRVFIRETANSDKLIVEHDGEEIEMFDTVVDGWGASHTVQMRRVVCISQEHGTRSFLSALMLALAELRRRNESTVDATVESL